MSEIFDCAAGTAEVMEDEMLWLLQECPAGSRVGLWALLSQCGGISLRTFTSHHHHSTSVG